MTSFSLQLDDCSKITLGAMRHDQGASSVQLGMRWAWVKHGIIPTKAYDTCMRKYGKSSSRWPRGFEEISHFDTLNKNVNRFLKQVLFESPCTFFASPSWWIIQRHYPSNFCSIFSPYLTVWFLNSNPFIFQPVGFIKLIFLKLKGLTRPLAYARSAGQIFFNWSPD